LILDILLDFGSDSLQCALVTLLALPFGLKVNLGGFLLALLLYALIGITMASLSYGFALIYKIEDPLAPTLNLITLPVLLLSGVLLPIALAPLWLQDVALLNPLAIVVVPVLSSHPGDDCHLICVFAVSRGDVERGSELVDVEGIKVDLRPGPIAIVFACIYFPAINVAVIGV